MAETLTPPGIQKILARIFTGRERTLLGGVFVFAVVAAVFETIGVASILPFMAYVLDPTALDRYPVLPAILNAFGATTERGQLLLIGSATAALVGLGNAAAALNAIAQERFAARTSARLQSNLFRAYLRQPFAFHVHRDAASLMKVVLSDVRIIVREVLTPVLLGVSRLMIVLGILVLLVLQNPVVAVLVAIVCGASYAAVFAIVRERQHRQGEAFDRSNLERHRVSQEGLGGIKELQVLGRTDHAAHRFADAAHRAVGAEASNRLTSVLPRYILETVAFGGILLVTLALVANASRSAQAVVPVLALYAFAGYRLMPALQQVFLCAVALRFHIPIVRGMHRDFELVAEGERPEPPRESKGARGFADVIRLHRVSFSYAGTRAPALRDVTLEIRRHESVGFVGRTGSGKTTLVDVLLGVYTPSSGVLTVDGVPLTPDRILDWQRHVGYVPQSIFLADASIAENIAFGLPPARINMDAVQRAAELAQADDFISELPGGFDTPVGERGVKLSGGQRQRIGIARALYHDPEVLVFDEATSALDGFTEDAVMDAIKRFRGARTVIIVAHRLATVEACDRIVLMERGRIVGEGTYTSLQESSPYFRRLLGPAHARRAGGLTA